MSDYKTILGILAVGLTFISYFFYFRNIFSGKTKPHAFSWLVWTLITAIVLAVQLVEHGGPGAWATGATTLMCFTVFILALFKGYKTFVVFDWIGFALALLTIVLWRLTDQPLIAAILVTVGDGLSATLTFRKGFYKPYEETVSTFALESLKWIVSIIALGSLTLSTWLYPGSLVLTNAAIAIMLLIRRRQTHKHAE